MTALFNVLVQSESFEYFCLFLHVRISKLYLTIQVILKHYCVINRNDGGLGCDSCRKTYASDESLQAQELQNTNIKNIKSVNNGARLFIELYSAVVYTLFSRHFN